MPLWIRQIRLGWALYFILAAALIAVEGGHFLDEGSSWKKYAALFWLGLSVGFLISTWGYVLSPFLDRRFWASRHSTWYVAAALVPASLIFLDIGGVTFNRLDGETTIQLANALDLLRHQASMGIFDMAFLAGSYPDRQYALACLPTYFFGPGMIAYRIGYALLYLGAYGSFLAAIRAYLQNRNAPEPLLLTSYAGMMVALAIYPLIAARLFEQLIMPLTVTMYSLAGLLFFSIKKSPYMAFWITWTFGFIPYCYSAALASWGLVFILLFYLAFQPGYRVMIVALIYGVAALACSIWMQYQHGVLEGKLMVGVAPEEHFTHYDWMWRFIGGARAVAGTDESIIPQPLVLSLLMAIYLSWRHREYRFFAICGWALATIVAALSFQGFCWRTPAADVSRSMAILPVLSLGVVLCLAFQAREWFDSVVARKIVIIGLIVSMIFMIGNSVTIPLLRRQIRDNPVEFPTDFDEGGYLLASIIHTPGLPPIQRVYLVPPLDFPLEDCLDYFAPGAHSFRGLPPPDDHTPGTYIISYRSTNPDDRNWAPDVPDHNPRPYLQVQILK